MGLIDLKRGYTLWGVEQHTLRLLNRISESKVLFRSRNIASIWNRSWYHNKMPSPASHRRPLRWSPLLHPPRTSSWYAISYVHRQQICNCASVGSSAVFDQSGVLSWAESSRSRAKKLSLLIITVTVVEYGTAYCGSRMSRIHTQSMN